MKQEIEKIITEELIAHITEVAFANVIPKEKGHHQGVNYKDICKNNAKILTEKLLEIIKNTTDEAIGSGYYFPDQCEWSKHNDPVPPFCIHIDCWRSHSINKNNKRIRDEILEIIKVKDND